MFDDYSTDELEIHYEAIIRKRARESKQLAMVIRLANNAKARTLAKYFKELDMTGWRIDNEMGRIGMDVGKFFFDLDNKLVKGRKS